MSMEFGLLLKLSDPGPTVLDPQHDVRGREVQDQEGRTIGTVEDLLIDERERQVRFLVVRLGAVTGPAATRTFVPVEAVTEVTPAVVIDPSGPGPGRRPAGRG